MQLTSHEKKVLLFGGLVVCLLSGYSFLKEPSLPVTDAYRAFPLSDEIRQFDQITYETTACDGGCRPFKALISGDATLEIRGTEFLEGNTAKDKLTPQQMDNLLKALNASGFLSMPARLELGTCAGPPEEEITVTSGGLTHSVHFHACGSIPQQLDNLERAIVAPPVRQWIDWTRSREFQVKSWQETDPVYQNAQKGMAPAQWAVANIYADPSDYRRNFDEAYFWFSLAAKAEPDNKIYLAHRDAIKKNLSPRQIEKLDKRIKEWKPAVGSAVAPAIPEETPLRPR